MAKNRSDRVALTLGRAAGASFASDEPLRVVESDGVRYLVADEVGVPGRRTYPLEDPTLATRFISLDDSEDAFVAYFQPLGHPNSGMRREKLTQDDLRAFGLARRIAIHELRQFRGALAVYCKAVADVTTDRRLALEYVPPIKRGGFWLFDAKVQGFTTRRSLPSSDGRVRWIAAHDFDERRFLACHVFLNDLLQELLTDRFELQVQLHRTAPFQVGHPIHYQPRDVLGAILFQVVDGLASGLRLSRCAHCGQPFMSQRSDRTTCSDRCRQAARRQRLAADERATVQQ